MLGSFRWPEFGSLWGDSGGAPIPAPTITQQPTITPASPSVGDTITLSLGAASGAPAPTAAWTLTRDGTDITDQVEDLTLTLTDPGEYLLTVTWTNSAGTATGTVTVVVQSDQSDGWDLTPGAGEITITSVPTPSTPVWTPGEGQVTITSGV